MDIEFAQKLCELNTRFYAENSASFSATRHASWEGWRRVCESVRTHVLASLDSEDNHVLRITDVACGNLRFEVHLMQEFPDISLQVAAFDNCDDLVSGDMPITLCSVSDAPCDTPLESRCTPGKQRNTSTVSASVPASASITFHHCDVMEALRGNTLESVLRCDPLESVLRNSGSLSDVSVAFGFMHHVPLSLWRIRVVQALIAATRAGGLVVLSLWRFMDNEAMAAKARRTHEEALDVLGWRQQAHQFGAQDLLMGWQNMPGAYRYCHSFTTQEIDELVDVVSDRADLVERFRADGRTHDLNEYLVFKVKHH